MASPLPLFLLLQLLTISATPLTSSSPYLSPSLFFPNYQKMLTTFKIFAYNATLHSFNATAESLFHASLLGSPFVTRNPEEAHLFYLHFPPTASPRSISRVIKDLQIQLPFWNRTLGADHFYLSCDGIGIESDRSLVELKKNSIQISCFSGYNSHFIPHKDITHPPQLAKTGFVRMTYLDQEVISYSHDLASDPDFLVKHVDDDIRRRILLRSKYCLFVYGGDMKSVGEALGCGCVPVVIAGRPVGDLAFADVLRWTEIAVFVAGVEEAKSAMRGTCGERYESMREMGMMVSKHFEWNSEDAPQPYDAFHMVLYQLWVRRHTIRYRRREVV